MYGHFQRERWTKSEPRGGGALIAALMLLVCPARAIWADTIEDAQAPPREMHFCWTNCFTLTFDNGVYRRTDGTDETWTVERFTAASVILRRHDAPAAWNGFSTDVLYQGQVANDRLISVTVDGRPVRDIDVAWGMALGSLPGSNAERDQRQSAQARPPALAVNSPPPSNDVEPAWDTDMSAADAPPPLLNYEQSPCPEDGYLWTPGYWGWSGAGYYWVPGAWVQPPRVGVLWTPGYWAFVGAVYVFRSGYWGPHIGYYGGINYGYGYVGSGFVGGRWVGNSFAYNRSFSNVNASVIHNVYGEAVVNNAIVNKVSYNGGPGGNTAVPTAEERAAAAESHMPATPRQRQIAQQSAENPALMARAYADHPAGAAAKIRGVTNVPGAVRAHGTAATTAGGQHDRPHPQTNTPHAQVAVEHPVAAGNTAQPQRTPERPATPKTAAATLAKPQHPKQ